MNKKMSFSLADLLVAFTLLTILSGFLIPEVVNEIKYGSINTTYDKRILKFYRIKGVIKSKLNKNPLANLKVCLNYKNLEAVTNKEGIFVIEFFNAEYKDYQIFIPEINKNSGAQYYDVKFGDSYSIKSDRGEAREIIIDISL